MIELRGVSRRYGNVQALAPINLKIDSAEQIVVTGPSGSGKSTLLRLIAGLEEPDTGELLLDGAVASKPGLIKPPHQREVGFVFQQPALWPHMTVAAHIEYPIWKLPRAERRERVDELLVVMKIEELANRRPAELSGGQARRVAVARALASRPARLLLDEPLVNLETEMRAQLIDYVAGAANQWRSTLIHVTHDPDEMGRLGGRVLRLENGSVV